MINICEYLVKQHTLKKESSIDLDTLIDTVCKDRLDTFDEFIKFGDNLWVKNTDTGSYSKWFKVWAFFYTHPNESVENCQKVMDIEDISHLNWHGLKIRNIIEKTDKNKYIGKDPEVWR